MAKKQAAQQWQPLTRGKLKYDILRTDGMEPFPILGALQTEYGWDLASWTSAGRYYRDAASRKDLLPLPKAKATAKKGKVK